MGLSLVNISIWRKLTVGQPNDSHEVEAERIAEKVMRIPDPAPSASGSALPKRGEMLQRKCAGCEGKKDDQLHRKPADAPSAASTAPLLVHEVLRSPGQPLDPASRSFMEPRFGLDFSRVRVHTDERAAESARAVNARAFTMGHQIVFGARQYAPGSEAGYRLLAHELAHTFQQTEPRLARAILQGGDELDAGVPPVKDAGLPGGVSTPPGGVAAAPPGPAAPPACAQPTNFTLGTATDTGPDAIFIPVTWDSSTGKLADLSSCTIREVVNYDPIPNPPFTWTPANPTILSVPATAGQGGDTHFYPPGLPAIVRPLVPGTIVAHQVYQYRCTGPGCSGNWTDLPTQNYKITREVGQFFLFTNPWRYRITKNGVGNPFSASRMVELTP